MYKTMVTMAAVSSNEDDSYDPLQYTTVACSKDAHDQCDGKVTPFQGSRSPEGELTITLLSPKPCLCACHRS